MNLPGALIFDMDGTLVDNMRFHEHSWLEMLNSCGLAVTAEEFHRRAAGRTSTDILREFLGDSLSAAEATEWAERKEAAYREAYAPHLRAIDGLHDFLQEARRLEIPMALATSGEEPNIRFVLEGLGLNDFFSAIVSGDEVARGKPDPEMFLLAARRLDVAPEQCVVFEDSVAGVEAARRAGMRTVVIATSLRSGDLQDAAEIAHVVPDYTSLNPHVLAPVQPA